MTTFPNSPRLTKGGLVLIDAESARVQRVISLQYNSDTLTRRFQSQETGGEGGGILGGRGLCRCRSREQQRDREPGEPRQAAGAAGSS